MTGLDAGGCVGDDDGDIGLAGVTAVTGGCVAAAGGLEVGGGVVGMLEGEAAGA